MALFTDGIIATLSDLKAYESSVLDLASTEAIDVSTKLALAQREIGMDITGFLLRRGVPMGTRRELNNVVVTEPLHYAHTMRTLALIYRDAVNSQLNDRYQGKWKQYSELATAAVKQLLDIGVGMTRTPLPKASAPSVTTTVGGLLTGATYSVRVAAASPGVTGEWSEAVQAMAVSGQLLVVEAPQLPANASGWVVYAGEAGQELTRQNEDVITADSAWMMPVTGLRNDLAALPVQAADYYAANGQNLLRG